MSGVSRRSTANSSPPRRAAMSEARRTEWRRSPTATSSASPAAWPRLSLTSLKSSRSTNSTIGTIPLGSAASRREATTWVNSDRFARPVSGSCEAWWWSSSLSRPSCSRDCSSWPFSSAIAVWLASVSNSLRSSASKVLMSLSGSDTRIVPMSVDSPSNGATSARRTRRRPTASVSPLGRQVDQPALPLGDRAHEDRIVEGRPDRLHDLDRVAGPDLAAQHLVARVPGQQPDLGDVGPEHLAGVVEQRDERRIELGAALEDPRRLEQQLDALVLLTLRDVGPVGQRRGDRRERGTARSIRGSPTGR